MTVDEVLKGLELCSTPGGGCPDECPYNVYDKNGEDCARVLKKDAMSLIMQTPQVKRDFNLEKKERIKLTYNEATNYLIHPVCTSTTPSLEFEKQLEAYYMALDALNELNRLEHEKKLEELFFMET